ncbi:hypothetical protein LTR53_011304 [Teratosphaeriaceae sp. CCFEE 6253]|nr:hypothetical protein LTR53_011304 [Teratosphaeriaceae sp. CCFEE 6253]
MDCILLTDGRRIDAGRLIANGADGFIIREGCHVLKIPQLFGRLHPDGTIEAASDNAFQSRRLAIEEQVYERLHDVPGVAKCIECTSNGILLKYYPNGSLSEYMSRHRPPSMPWRWHWALQAAEIIARCHARGVLVFDIALRNFLLTDGLNLRIIDFANSTLVPLSVDITRTSVDGCTVRLDMFHLSNVIFSILTWQTFSVECAMESEWPDINHMPNTSDLDCSSMIEKCWARRYNTIEDLILEMHRCAKTLSSTGPLECQTMDCAQPGLSVRSASAVPPPTWNQHAFVPVEVRQASLTYVRISAFSALTSAIQYAVAAATRALDLPDVPLIISIVQFTFNIILDMAIISKYHAPSLTPTVNTQAATQLACNIAAASAGLIYFLAVTARQRRRDSSTVQGAARPALGWLKLLARPGAFTFMESAVRNALYLWLVTGIVAMGSDYATAWGVFNTIRWGLIMVPVQALEATSLTFVGHAWGAWRRMVGPDVRRPTATRKDIKGIISPALVSCAIVLAVEVPLCLLLSFYGARRFAYFISGSAPVSHITAHMWRTVDWTYIFYGISTQLATILLSTRPRWYLYQSLVSNNCWVLPWAIAVSRIGITPETAWTYHSIVFGGSLVFSFFDILIVDAAWGWALLKGRVTLPPIGASPVH